VLHWIIVHIHRIQDEYIKEIHQLVPFFDLNQRFEFLDLVHHGKNEILARQKKIMNNERHILMIITYIWLVLAITITSSWSSTHFLVVFIYLKIFANLFRNTYATKLYIRNREGEINKIKCIVILTVQESMTPFSTLIMKMNNITHSST
jgi:hypothetical protein